MDISASPTGKYLAVHTDASSGRIIVFRSPSQNDLLSGAIPTQSKKTLSPLKIVKDLYGVDSDAFSRPKCKWDPSGKLIFATGDSGTIFVFSVLTGSCISKLEGHDRTVRGLAVDVVRKQLLSCSFDLTVKTWDT